MPKQNSLSMMKSQMPNCRDIITMCLAEIIGTGILIFFGCMGAVDKNSIIAHFEGCFAFGMVVMLIITTFGHISQAHLNPAVTICAAMLGGLPVLMAPLYIISQIVGAIIGYGMLKLVTPEALFTKGLCVTEFRSDLNLLQGFMVELLATSALVLLCCGVWDPRNAARQDSVPIKFGFAITTLALLAGPYTGCSMNPARSFGPALYNGMWENHWVYWVAPCLAAALITTIYMVIFGKPKEDVQTAGGPEDIPLRNT